MSEIVWSFDRVQKGDPLAAERLLPLVYQELRRLAAEKIRREKPDQTLQATDLVHEAYLRLVGTEDVQGWDNRRHFFSVAAEAMRRHQPGYSSDVGSIIIEGMFEANVRFDHESSYLQSPEMTKAAQ